MLKVLFVPLGIVGGFAAGLLGTAVFERVWSLFDEEEPPDPKHRDVSWAKLLLASALEGAIFKAIRSVVDRGSRTAVMNVTGSWPGPAEPDQRP